MKEIDEMIKVGDKDANKCLGFFLLAIVIIKKIAETGIFRVLKLWVKDAKGLFELTIYKNVLTKNGKIIFNYMEMVFSFSALYASIVLFALVGFAFMYADLRAFDAKQWGLLMGMIFIGVVYTKLAIANGIRAKDRNALLKRTMEVN